ncbi:metallophosphoesterase [Pseudomonas sp. NPDC090233]|uniref:metallophosphoesterase n=1 Tax=Pseudomonas sp. NPDC090233 TaxID=3364479 RepID=UPI00383BF251
MQRPLDHVRGTLHPVITAGDWREALPDSAPMHFAKPFGSRHSACLLKGIQLMTDSLYPEVLPPKKPGRFGNRATPRAFVIASDPQYPWTPASDDGEEQPSNIRDRLSRELIAEQYASIASYRASLGGTGIPVMINGDMTAYGHAWQRGVVYPLIQEHLKENYYFGLGNHDYKNNIDDTLNNAGARDSVLDLINHHQQLVDTMHLSISENDLQTGYDGSLAYSMSFGRVRLIQLNNEPTYKVRFSSGLPWPLQRNHDFNITSSLDWLEVQLKESYRHGQVTLVNLHQPDEWDGDRQERQRFRSMLQHYRVNAVFAGHYHKEAGHFSSAGSYSTYLSGSASQETYLLAELSDDADFLTIKCVRNNNWSSAEVLDRIKLY